MIHPLIVVIPFFIWVVFLVSDMQRREPVGSGWTRRVKTFFDSPQVITVVILFCFAFAGWGHYLDQENNFSLTEFAKDFYGNYFAEIIGIALTVYLIDRINRHRDQDRESKIEKDRLIDEMGSTDNAIALLALKRIKDQGWLEDGTLAKEDFSQANLENAQMHHAALQGVDLSDAKLINARLFKADLSDAFLLSANFTEANLFDGKLTGANLVAANLTKAEMRQTKLMGADLTIAILRDTTLIDADLSNAKVIYADLRGARLDRANLTGTNFSLADMSGASLRDATLAGADFYDTKYTDSTRWPDEFDPQAAGAKKISFQPNKQKRRPTRRLLERSAGAGRQ